ncbi:MAG TPA: SLC13 family permease, partial [Usitatibacteraceae bacterium]|nr:SLC13 family permease [Usitatibacteraceae bacterium]
MNLSHVRAAGLVGGPLLAVLLYFALPVSYEAGGTSSVPFGHAARATLAMVAWMATWWMTEAVDIEATALLPLAVFPLLGIAPLAKAAAPYASDVIFLFLGGFLLGLAIERWGLHRRMALAVLLRIGTSPRRLVLGMMVATAVASMWIANTAATLIMLPIGLALIARLENELAKPVLDRFAASLCLAIAYGASVGGIGTPLGTPPNLIYLGAVEKHFGAAPGFLEWMGFAVPIAALIIAFVYLYFVY